MNTDMLAAGVELGDRFDFDLVHGHDWLVAVAGDHLAKRFGAPLAITIHATEYGRHQGWVDKHPQSHIHGIEHWMANRAEQVIACSAYMRDHIADIYAIEEERDRGDPERDRPRRPPAVGRGADARAALRFAAPHEKLVLLVGRLVYEKGFQVALEAMPRVIERARRRALPGRRLGHARAGAARAGDRARARRARHLHGLDRRRRAAHALPDRRPDGRALDLRAVRARGARGDGVGLPVPGRRHRRPARGRAARGGRAALPLARPGARWPTSRSACWPTTSSAGGSWPRPTSTCAASTGPTWPSRRRRVYGQLAPASRARSYGSTGSASAG